MHPYLILVLAGYVAFVVALGGYWFRDYVDALRASRDTPRTKLPDHAFRRAA